MRGSNESPQEPDTTQEYPNGKVLERLELFNNARGMDFDTTPAEEEKPRKRRKAVLALEGEDAVITDVSATDASKSEVASLYAEAAMALQHEPVAMATLDVLDDGAADALALPAWYSLGPTVMNNGQTYGDTRVQVSGRVSAIAINPSNSNHILCGSAAGGVWESRDGGVTWWPRTDQMPTLTVGALAFNRSSPNIVYCGTGEGNFYAWLGAGLLRSTDGGTTWAVLATAPFVGQGFYDLIVDPANGNHLLAATTNGLYESTNAGTNWTQRRSARTWSISMHPTGGAAAEVLAACSDGLFRSTNGGTTWAAGTLTGAPTGVDRMAVSHARSNPNVAYVFLARGATVYIGRRTTAGGAFTAIPAPAGLTTGQAWYDWFAAAAPDRDNQLYLGAIEAYRGDLVGATWTWVKISNKAGDDIHPDQHAIAFDPANANVVYVGNDGGLFRSTNRGTNWAALNNGLAITEIEYIAQDYGSARWLIGGTQDNGSIRYTGSSVWEHIADGDGGDCGVDRGTPTRVFHSFYNMGMERSTTSGNFGSFSWIGPNVPTGYQALFYPPMECNGTTIAQAGQSVYVSRNSGTTWTQVALPANLIASAMYIPTPERVFVGTTVGRIFRIDWSGTAWSSANELTRPRTAWTSDLFVSSSNLNQIWATFTTLNGGRVFRSDNGGSTWLDQSAGLPLLPINAVEVDPGNANRVWVAADIGVHQSLNGGATWSAFSQGLPNVLTTDLLFHPHTRLLRAGTRNRGIWEIPVDGRLTKPICGVQWTGTLAGNATKSWFTFNWPATWHIVWTVMPTTPLPGNPQVSWKVQVERASAEYATYWITVKNLTAVPVTFEGHYAILSYY